MKSTLRVAPILVFLNTAPALFACSSSSEVLSGRCDPVVVRTLIGRPKLTDEEAKQQSGVTIVRQIAPGQPVTHDYRNDRVTLETDPVSGRVLGATCG